jgi:PilZ domain
MESRPEALLFSADQELVRVFRRVLSDLDIDVEHCAEGDLALTKFTRRRFDAVIADCSHPQPASRILNGFRCSVANKRAVTVAVVDQGKVAPKEVCEAAHFVLPKPVSLERTRTAFQAARALMSRERRRRARIPIELPVDLSFNSGEAVRVVTSDLGEDGMAVNFEGQRPYGSSFLVSMNLPGASATMHCRGELAWEGSRLMGVRFSDVDSEVADELGRWIMHQLAGAEVDDSVIGSRLTDLSLGACYLQTESPFPLHTRLRLMMKVGELELQIEGIVRVMHPEMGMGVEFRKHTPALRERVEEFIETLLRTAGAIPDVQVRPESIVGRPEPMASNQVAAAQWDPLVSLFISKGELPAELFQAELRKQRREDVPFDA